MQSCEDLVADLGVMAGASFRCRPGPERVSTPALGGRPGVRTAHTSSISLRDAHAEAFNSGELADFSANTHESAAGPGHDGGRRCVGQRERSVWERARP